MKLSNYRPLLIFIAGFIAMLIMSKLYTYSFENFTLSNNKGLDEQVEFPLIKEAPGYRSSYTLAGSLNLGRLSPKVFNIIPDDELYSLTINGKKVDLSDIPKADLRNYQTGAIIDLSAYLHKGSNQLVFTYYDRGGKMGIKMQAPSTNWRTMSLFLGWITLFVYALILIAQKIGLPARYQVLLVAALLIRMSYWMITDWNIRGHDTYEHIDYIEYFVEHKSVPPIEMSAQRIFFHPPFYYASSALFYVGIDKLFPGHPSIIYRSLQLLSITYSMLFLVFAVQLIRLFFKYIRKVTQKLKPNASNIEQKSWHCFFCAAMVCFWPSAILHSNRIGNDPLLYLLIAAAVYYMQRYYILRREKDAMAFCAFGSLAIITKVSGALLFGAAAIIFLLMFARGKIRFDIKLLSKVAAISLSALAFALYPGFMLKQKGGKDHVYIENIDNLHSGLRVGNKPQNYLWFDTKIFLTQPYTSPWEDKMGRQYFWNYLSKTSLFGEWRFPGKKQELYASIISLSFLIIVLYTAIGFFYIRRIDAILLAPLLAFTISMFAAVTYMRISFPVNIDFRYVLPTVPALLIFYNYFLLQLKIHGRQRAAAWGNAAQIIFIFSTALFCLSLYQHYANV